MLDAKFVAGLASLLVFLNGAQAGEKTEPKLQSRFETTLQPFLKAHCMTCHGAKKSRGDVTLHEMRADAKDIKAVAHWERVLEQPEIGMMPPEKNSLPMPRERVDVIEWITDYLIQAGKGFTLRSKSLLPEFGNRVNHELLIDGSIKNGRSSSSADAITASAPQAATCVTRTTAGTVTEPSATGTTVSCKQRAFVRKITSGRPTPTCATSI